jgi:CheY-like chemotaxis protein
MMPVMDGAALLDALEKDPRFAEVPVVVMSSMPEAAFAERSRRYASYVRKPFQIYEFLDSLKRFL